MGLLTSRPPKVKVPPGDGHADDDLLRPPVSAIVASSALLVAAALLWLRSLGSMDLRRMNDLGLISVLPVEFGFALFLLAVSFAITLSTMTARRMYVRLLLVSQIVVLVLILYGTPALVEEVPRTAAFWRHLGIANWIDQQGAVDTSIDAYFDWPGYFIALAFIRHVTGLGSLAGIGAWAPPFFNLLYAGALFHLFKSSFGDERPTWLAIWIFLSTNWVAQDYLSPQGFGYFIYLVILLMLLLATPAVKRQGNFTLAGRRVHELVRIPRRLSRAWPSRPSRAGMSIKPWAVSPVQRTILIATVTVLFSAIAISHQLTPYAILVVVAGLIAVNASSARAMPLLMALVIFTWFTYAATPFLVQFLPEQKGSFGEVQQNFSATVIERVQGTRQHEFVVYVRVIMTLGLWIVATLSAAVRLWRGHRDAPFIILALAPVTLIALQSYGGEIALRVYFFSLPAAAFFVAASLAHAFGRWGPTRTALTISALCCVLLPLFLIARYGNERLDYFTEDEFHAVQYAYQISAPGSAFFVLNGNLPLRSHRYAADHQVDLGDYVRLYGGGYPGVIANTMLSRRPSFLVLTRAQYVFAPYVGGISPTVIRRFRRRVETSPRFRRIYSNRDAVIYEAVPKAR